MFINHSIYKIANLMRKAGFNFHEEHNEKVLKMQQKIKKLGKIEFKIEQYPDGTWTAESINIDGIITGGKNTKNIIPIIKDSIFTYFEIPPYLCRETLLN